jgi:hypothetical protein
VLRSYALRLFPLVGAALPQFAGLFALIVIVKLIGDPATPQRLPAYNFALSAVAIVFLGVAYAKARATPTFRVSVGINIVLWVILIGAYLVARPGTLFTVAASFFVLAVNALIHLHLVRSYSRFTYIIVASVIALAAPQVLWVDGITTFAVAALLSGINLVLARAQPIQGEAEDKLAQSISGMFYSVLLQAPLLSVTLYDPFIAKIVGSKLYVDYAIYLKIFNGIFVFIFAKAQLDILTQQSYEFDSKKLRAYIFALLAICIIVAFFNNVIALIVQCIILALSVNLISIFVRSHLLFENMGRVYVAYCVTAFILHILFISYMLYYGLGLYTYVPVLMLFLVVACWPALFSKGSRTAPVTPN